MEIKTTNEIIYYHDVDGIGKNTKWVRVDDDYIDSLEKLQDGLKLIQQACNELSQSNPSKTDLENDTICSRCVGHATRISFEEGYKLCDKCYNKYMSRKERS